MEISKELINFINEVKTEFLSSTSYYLPEYSIQYSEDTSAGINYDSYYILEIPINAEAMDKIMLAATLFHEFAHLHDMKICDDQNIDKQIISSISEIHAGYIEMKYLSKHLNEVETEEFITQRTQWAIDEFTNGDMEKCFKYSQYVCGYLKCLSESTYSNWKVDFSLTLFNAIYGDTLKTLYNSIDFPFIITNESVEKCFDICRNILPTMIKNYTQNFNKLPTNPPPEMCMRFLY